MFPDAEVAVFIKTTTVYGARHALETVSQLIATSDNQLVIVTSATVSDKPAYPHRGLLLDTARNYLPLYAIQRTINAMSACKLNVLHWHATDSQSFPLLLPRVPQLARYNWQSLHGIYALCYNGVFCALLLFLYSLSNLFYFMIFLIYLLSSWRYNCSFLIFI